MHRAVLVERHKEVYEYWPSDILQLFKQACIPRRMPPNNVDCSNKMVFTNEAESVRAPKITSPLRGVIYTIRLSDPDRQTIPLSASIDASSKQLYRFANTNFIGAVPRGITFYWKWPPAGSYVLRAVDEHGSSATRDLRVEWIQ